MSYESLGRSTTQMQMCAARRRRETRFQNRKLTNEGYHCKVEKKTAHPNCWEYYITTHDTGAKYPTSNLQANDVADCSDHSEMRRDCTARSWVELA